MFIKKFLIEESFQQREQLEELKRLTAVCIGSSFYELSKYIGPKLYQLLMKKKSGQELHFANYFHKN